MSEKLLWIDPSRSSMTVTTRVQLYGYAADTSASSGTGVTSASLFYVPPNAPQIFLGLVTTGLTNTQAAFEIGPQFNNAGFAVKANLPDAIPEGFGIYKISATSAVDGQIFFSTIAIERVNGLIEAERYLMDLAASGAQDFQFRAFVGPPRALLNSPSAILSGVGVPPELIADGNWVLIGSLLKNQNRSFQYSGLQQLEKLYTLANSYSSASVIVTTAETIPPMRPGDVGIVASVLRLQDRDNFYMGLYDFTGRIGIWRFRNGVGTPLASAPYPASRFATYRITFYDSSASSFVLTVSKADGSSASTISAVDTDYRWTQGAAGIAAGPAGLTLGFASLEVRSDSQTFFSQSFSDPNLLNRGFWTEVTNHITGFTVSDMLDQHQPVMTVTAGAYHPNLFRNDNAFVLWTRVSPWSATNRVTMGYDYTLVASDQIGSATTASGFSPWGVFAVGFIRSAGVQVRVNSNRATFQVVSALDYLNRLHIEPHQFNRINLALNRPTQTSSVLTNPALESESGEFIGLPSLDGAQAVDGNRDTLWISNGVPQVAQFPGGDYSIVPKGFSLVQVYPRGPAGTPLRDYQWFSVWVRVHGGEGGGPSSNELCFLFHKCTRVAAGPYPYAHGKVPGGPIIQQINHTGPRGGPGIIIATNLYGDNVGWTNPVEYPQNKLIVFCYNKRVFLENWRVDPNLVEVLEYGRQYPWAVLDPAGDGIRLMSSPHNYAGFAAPNGDPEFEINEMHRMVCDEDCTEAFEWGHIRMKTLCSFYWGGPFFDIPQKSGSSNYKLCWTGASPDYGVSNRGDYINGEPQPCPRQDGGDDPWGDPLHEFVFGYCNHGHGLIHLYPAIRPGHSYHTFRYDAGGNRVPHLGGCAPWTLIPDSPGFGAGGVAGFMELRTPRIANQFQGTGEWIMVDLGTFADVKILSALPAPGEPGYQATSASISVDPSVSLADFPDKGGYIQIDNEYLSYTSIVQPNTFSGVTRGVLGSTAIGHPAGSPVLVLEFDQTSGLWVGSDRHKVAALICARRAGEPAFPVPMQGIMAFSHLDSPSPPVSDYFWESDWSQRIHFYGNHEAQITWNLPQPMRARWALVYIEQMSDPRNEGAGRAKINEISVWAAPVNSTADHSGINDDGDIVRHLLFTHAGLSPAEGDIFGGIPVGNLQVTANELGAIIAELADRTGKLWRFDRWNRFHYEWHPLDAWSQQTYRMLQWDEDNILELNIERYPNAQVSQVQLDATMVDDTTFGYLRAVQAVYPAIPRPLGQRVHLQGRLAGSEAQVRLQAERLFRYANRGWAIRIRTGVLPSAEPGHRAVVRYTAELPDGRSVYFRDAIFFCTGVHISLQQNLGSNGEVQWRWITELDYEQAPFFQERSAIMDTAYDATQQ